MCLSMEKISRIKTAGKRYIKDYFDELQAERNVLRFALIKRYKLQFGGLK